MPLSTFLATQTDADAASALSPMVVMILVVCVLGLGVIFIIYTRSKIDRKNAEHGTPRERLEEIKGRAEQEGQLNTSMTELLEVSRRLAAQLDNKAERLEQLLAEADQRIAALGGLAAKPGPNGSPNGSRGGDSDHAGEKLEHLKRETGEIDSSLHDEIHRLADEGYSPVEIAQRLDEHTGKVELVLALREK